MKLYKSSPIAVMVQGTSLIKVVVAAVILLFFLFSVSGFVTMFKSQYRFSSPSVYESSSAPDGKVFYYIFGWENHLFFKVFPEKKSMPTFTNMAFTVFTNISLDDPRSLLGRELPGFSLFDGKIIVAGQGTNYTNLPIESAPPLEILKTEQEIPLGTIKQVDDSVEQESHTPSLTTGQRKVVYLYFSHNRESFLPYLKGETDPNKAHHSKINVTKIGDYLKEKLESHGIGTISDSTDIMSNLSKKGLSYGKAYDESRNVVTAALTSNRDLKYLIDIHRDSRRKKDTSIKINGKTFAKVAFVIGAENPSYEKNLRLATEIHKKLEKKYPGLSRGVIEKKGAHTNGKFNQDLSGNALLIEFGGVDNTFEELNRTANVFAEVFSEIYWEAEPVNKPINESAEEQ